MTDQLPRLIKPTNPQGPSNKRERAIYEKGRQAGVAEAAEELDALKAALDEAETDVGYQASACDSEIIRAIRAEAERDALKAEALEVVRELARIHRSVSSDILTAHNHRGPGASGEMTSDDRDLRSDFYLLGDKARAFLAKHGGTDAE